MKKINFKKFALSIAILVVLNLFINYGIYTFYKSPKIDDYCEPFSEKLMQTKEECESLNGRWIGVPEKSLGEGWCDQRYFCEKGFNIVNDLYKRNTFVIWIILGIIAITLGVIIKTESVSNGFLFGGITAIIIGTIKYWSAMQDYLRFIILGIALAFLIWLGYKKLRD